MDVIEIDAASNTQVDKTREVILDHAQYRAGRSRFKIYIIDEVHMLSKASFNALLKTLEEPPEHVKFILATTEPEKILPTIISRCQRYDFRNIPTREIAGHLKEILKKEKIKADDEAVLLIAKAGAGSMRDTLSLLDRLLSVGEKQLSVQTIEQYLGLPRSQAIFDLAQRVGEGKVAEVLKLADKLICEGLSADTLANALSDHLRNLMVVRTCGADSELIVVVGLSSADVDEEEARQAAPYQGPVAIGTEDNDDDLPAPGKVWESGGPSLVEMMKSGPVVVEAKPAVEKSNVEAVDEKDLPAVWGKLMELLKNE